MAIEAPNLDDRDFQQLLAEATGVIRKHSPQWTDLSPSDPGMILLEAFAHLTEVMIYRLNRLPQKAYVEFLRLIGVKLYPPSAATVSLRFSLSRSQNEPVEVPRGVRVTIGRVSGSNEAPVFVTTRAARIEPGEQSAEAPACHCELIEGELIGVGSGAPGQTFAVARPPIIAPTGDDLDLIVGVEALPQELNERVPAVKHGDKTFRIWREIGNLSEIGQDRFVYMSDRVNGAITFIPALRTPDGDGLSAHPARLAEVAT
ncbi:MAG TPA: phage baseplate protein, partial [Blastocatellia bacterium]|nr:phage baseplate protein [Blastocatellia bacterium]